MDRSKFSYYFGDKAFYRNALAVAVPIMIQNSITTFVSLLDNIMVGSVGTIPMSAVAIVNKLIFVYNLCLFGGCAGIGIFTAQYFGKGDHDGLRKTFRLKLYTNLILFSAALALFLFAGDDLIRLFLHDDNAQSVAQTLGYARQYLSVMLLGMLPQAITECYAGTLRETQNTKLPMFAGTVAVITNLCLNYVLIFGNFGAPALGVTGAAIATVISKYVEMLILILCVHSNKRFAFLKGVYDSPKIPMSLVRRILPKSFPLLINEGLWALGTAALTYCYSLRGLTVVAGYNISATISDLFNVASLALGSSIAIIVGNKLGSGDMEEAKRTDTRLIIFSLIVSFFLCILLYFTAPLFPLLYRNTDLAARTLAVSLLRIYAIYLILNSITCSCYFTIRSGGKTFITFMFDSVYTLGIAFSVTFVVAYFTTLPILPLYAISLFIDIIKCIMGLIIVRSNKWMRNIVSD